MDALEALGDDRAHAQKARALGRPVAGGAIAIFLARQQHERGLLGLIAHGGVIDRDAVARGIMGGEAAFGHVAVGLLVHEVLDADIGEGAAHHHFMVAAPRAVLVEVRLAHLALGQPLASRRGQLDGACRRDVVGGDLVAEERENARIDNVLDGIGGHGHALEIGRMLHIGGVHAPLEGLAHGRLHLAPVRVAVEHVRIALLEHLLGHELLDEGRDFLGGGPDVLEINVLPVLALAQRLGGQVHMDVASQRIGDDEGRRGQIVGLHIRVDAAFEVAVARDHGGGDGAVVVDGLGDLFGQRAGVADAGGAAVTDEVEAELVELLLQAGVGEIFAHDLRARRQRGLHPGLGAQALGHRIARQQARRDQHAGVGGVGAGGDGRDGHVAMAQIKLLAGNREALGDLVTLAILGLHRRLEDLRHVFEGLTAFGTLGASHGGHDGGQIELERVREDRIGRLGGAEQALGLGVFLDERHASRLAVRVGEEVEGLAVDGEVAAGRAIFRCHVADGGAVGEAQVVEAGAEELDELAHHALLAQHLGDGQHQIGGGDAFLQLAGELEADDFGQQHGEGLAEHAGLGLDAAHAPAQNRQAIDHGRVRISAHQRVGIGDVHSGGLAALGGVLFLLRPDGLGEIFQVHLMADAGAGGHDREVLEGALAPLEELIALAVALIFQIHVLLEGLGVAELVDDHRMVDHEIDGDQRVDALGLAAELGHGVTHGGQIHHGGNAREVLHQHARGTEGDFLLATLAAIDQPFGATLDVSLCDRAAVLEAQEILDQHLHGIGKLGDALEAILLGDLEREVMVGLGAYGERFAAFETVERHVLAPVRLRW